MSRGWGCLFGYPLHYREPPKTSTRTYPPIRFDVDVLETPTASSIRILQCRLDVASNNSSKIRIQLDVGIENSDIVHQRVNASTRPRINGSPHQHVNASTCQRIIVQGARLIGDTRGRTGKKMFAFRDTPPSPNRYQQT